MAMEFQSPVLVITAIKPQQKEALTDFLSELNDKLWNQGTNPFGEFNLQHFARWVVINDQLIFAASVDGSADAYLQALAEQCTHLIQKVYKHCDHFPDSPPSDTESVTNYLQAHQQATAMFYHGLRNRTVADIQLEDRIHQAIEAFLDNNQDNNEFKAEPADKIYATIKAHLKGVGIEYNTTEPYFFSKLTPSLKAKAWWRLPALGLGVVVMLMLIPYILFMEWRERRTPSGLSPFLVDSKAEDLDIEEIQAVQSPMTSIVAIKPGLFRRYALKSVLWALQVLADHYYNKGRLGSIGSIHFARWAIINNGQHLLFLSNYDGSWESYLGAFIDRAAVGLTGVWGNAVDFPPSHCLLWGGATHAADFKAYAKRSQVITHFWYSAYPTISMPNKLNNRAIREFLIKPGKRSASRWLKRF